MLGEVAGECRAFVESILCRPFLEKSLRLIESPVCVPPANKVVGPELVHHPKGKSAADAGCLLYLFQRPGALGICE